jgi:transposase
LIYLKSPWTALFPPAPGGGKEVDHGYKGKGSLIHLLVDKEGKPLGITCTSAKGNERVEALSLLKQLHSNQIKDTKSMTILEADKGYDSDSFRQELLGLGYVPLIGYRKSRKEKVSTKEIANYFHVTSHRWMVERTFSWLKRKCRRLMLRWERKHEIWGSFAKLGVIFMWLETLLG